MIPHYSKKKVFLNIKGNSIDFGRGNTNFKSFYDRQQILSSEILTTPQQEYDDQTVFQSRYSHSHRKTRKINSNYDLKEQINDGETYGQDNGENQNQIKQVGRN